MHDTAALPKSRSGLSQPKKKKGSEDSRIGSRGTRAQQGGGTVMIGSVEDRKQRYNKTVEGAVHCILHSLVNTRMIEPEMASNTIASQIRQAVDRQHPLITQCLAQLGYEAARGGRPVRLHHCYDLGDGRFRVDFEVPHFGTPKRSSIDSSRVFRPEDLKQFRQPLNMAA